MQIRDWLSYDKLCFKAAAKYALKTAAVSARFGGEFEAQPKSMFSDAISW